ncbi:ATP-binding cassette domain-containing protein [Paenibacillus sp. NFR01]|uniref:ATP-binding cassette domain-containing protein n=1 Tax=Paenibacillus sp. NFR01 TaxID=1566279 RepID=UPI0008B5BDBB|nr:ATP-binding cassette domain-containing protein [Paenibacillus sp. NFR01]SEU11928.1 energy-coupling factor transport system ATP-binding protein [Paenibacillus sp. NFR01]
MSIRAEGIAYRYDSTPLLHGIDLEIREGTLAVLCGVTGSGKSTLLRLLSGLLAPQQGRILYAGGPEAEISIVFQQPETQLFLGSVNQEVEYGLKERSMPKAERLRQVSRALGEAGLPQEIFGERSPFLLSGGEKRRLTLADAAAVSPRVLLLDEPTAGLDPRAAAALLARLQELRRGGMTLVVATHDLDSFIPLSDQVIVMAGGAVAYDGPPGPLAERPGIWQAAGLTPPAYAAIGHRLMARGWLGRMPESMEALLAELEARPLPPPPPRHPADAAAAPAGLRPEPSGPQEAGPDPAAGGRGRWQRLDPRVKWLGMMLGTLVILGMDQWPPLLLAAALMAGLIRSAGIPGRRCLRFFRPFLLMFSFLWLLSALSWNTPGAGSGFFSYAGFVRGGINVLRLLLLIALGFLFTETTTGAPLREALEWAIAPLRRLGIRTRNASLAVSVTLQFIPWILDKLVQLQTALRSRGRRKSGKPRWTPRQAALLTVPLLILVIGMGDDLAAAVESRGYDPDKTRTPSFQLQWRKADTAALAAILVTAALLWGFSRFS